LRPKDYREIELAKNAGHPSILKQIRESVAAAGTDPCQCKMICMKKETDTRPKWRLFCRGHESHYLLIEPHPMAETVHDHTTTRRLSSTAAFKPNVISHRLGPLETNDTLAQGGVAMSAFDRTCEQYCTDKCVPQRYGETGLVTICRIASAVVK
jgi:hypothetical protein